MMTARHSHAHRSRDCFTSLFAVSALMLGACTSVAARNDAQSGADAIDSATLDRPLADGAEDAASELDADASAFDAVAPTDSSEDARAEDHADAALCTPARPIATAPVVAAGGRAARGLDELLFGPCGPYTSARSLLVASGRGPTESVPATLDLAERAQWFTGAMTQSMLPDTEWPPVTYEGASVPGIAWGPAGPAIFHPGDELMLPTPECGRWRGGATLGPCFELDGGPPNWGKVALALFAARLMHGDHEPGVPLTNTTLFRHYESLRSMLSYETTFRLSARGVSPIVLQTPSTPLAPASVAAEALVFMYRHQPDPRLREAINDMIDVHCSVLDCDATPAAINAAIRALLSPARWDYPVDTEQGTMGRHLWRVFISAKAMILAFEWYRVLASEGNAATPHAQRALRMGYALSDYARNEGGSIFWDPSRSGTTAAFTTGPGHFVGHIHSYLQSVLGLLAQAAIIESGRPASGTPERALADALVLHSEQVFDFVLARTRAGEIGNFGEIGTVGDMIRVALALHDLGRGDHLDQVDRWVRNQLVESQIDPAAAMYIRNESGAGRPNGYTNIGARSMGAFFSDATHSLAIPTNRNFRYNVDGPSNAMRAIFEVWRRVVEESSDTITVNFLLNHAHRAALVRSELPFRGHVEVQLQPRPTALRRLRVRLPEGVSSATVTASGAAVASSIVGRYLELTAPSRSETYTIQFALTDQRRPIEVVRDQSSFWYEGSFNTAARSARDTFTAVMRGPTLVDVEGRPPAGTAIPRFQRAAERAGGPAPRRAVSGRHFVTIALP